MKHLVIPVGFVVLVLASQGAQAASTTRIQKTFNNWRVDCAEIDNQSKR